MEQLDEKTLLSLIKSANNRSDAAQARHDAEAFENACDCGSHYYKQLVDLVGVAKALRLVTAD